MSFETSELERYAEIRHAALGWSAHWEGIDSWPGSIEEQWLDLQHDEDENARVNWLVMIWQHAQNGRRLFADLTEVDGSLPRDDPAVRELWRQQLQTAELLTRGITTLEIWAGIIAGNTGLHVSEARRLEDNDPESESDSDSLASLE